MNVVLIERQDFWRQRCASALEDRGHSVVQLDSYDDVADGLPAPRAADLVILGCTSVGPAEVRLVGEMRRRRDPVLLMCSLPGLGGMRAGFLAGARDVVERPYEPARIVATVEGAVAGLAANGPSPAAPAGARRP